MKSMHKTVNSFVVVTSILASSVAIAKVESNFKSYVGADVQIRHMNFQNGYGQNLFKHDITQGNVFFGVSLTENFRIEAGYEANPGKTRTTHLQRGEISGGIPVITPREEMSTTRIHGPHISLVAVLPLQSQPNFKWIGSVGVAHLNMNLVRNTSAFLLSNGGRLDPRSIGRPTLTTFLQTKNILKLSVGFEYDLSQNWGVRTLVGWENTKKFNIPSLESDSISFIKPQNSLLYSIGVFMKL